MIPSDPTLANEAAYQTLKWILEGQHERDIIEAIKTKYPAEDPQATIAAVIQHLIALAGADPIVLRGFALAAYREIYCRAMSIGDFANALRCVKELARAGGAK